MRTITSSPTKPTVVGRSVRSPDHAKPLSSTFLAGADEYSFAAEATVLPLADKEDDAEEDAFGGVFGFGGEIWSENEDGCKRKESMF